MGSFDFDLIGTGRVELPAYGIADAEARVEKEIRELLPAARVTILDVARRLPGARIVEDFDVSYRVTLTLREEAADLPRARREALRRAREAVLGSRYARITWAMARQKG